jgi:hypothetical protein
MRALRARQKEHVRSLEKTVETLTVGNRNTREKFETQCRSPYVIVFADPDEGISDYAGVVVGFHPSDMVSVSDATGYVHVVPLRKVKEDVGRRIYAQPRW